MNQDEFEAFVYEAEEARLWVEALQSHYDTVTKLQGLGFTAKLSKQTFTPPRHPRITLVFPKQPLFFISLWDTGVSFSSSEGKFIDVPQYAERMFELHALVVVVAEILAEGALPRKSLFNEHGLSDSTWDDAETYVCESGYMGDGLWYTASGWEDRGR